MLTQKGPCGKGPMPPTKIRVFLDDFPWVRRYLDEESIAQVHVTRVEPDLLSYAHQHTERDQEFGVLITPEYTEKLYLLDEQGELVTVNFERRSGRRRYWLFGPIVYSTEIIEVTGEVGMNSTVMKTLDALGHKAAKRVHFILSHYKGRVILYKSPKDLSVGEWVNRQLEAEKADLKQTIATIDAEASR